ncbi:D-alanyl-D-alanine carboxypeptidase [Ectothiorhodospira haloalkaliphila]|uniref:serine-type D-Ala-D-Ala carboxypeptidase n=1 Tax=Ectothiorhodospira haloalkaliphila TaxID=421628 RepID=W8L349_9GAMM|nr:MULTISPECIES: D-alanyl-D-alanine carboxypeptidase family protein [Ectothiorhodospira]AHK78375.1 D-alanyl-D-alanine carboxypeptidase [Ectothiorhodospira haloalkaliphila]MCG5495658.1 D-alanyl-D-alanine carboxypeptidase [Ectothiorhodospira variabilis]MCG5498853.1 D-alanyl-D-alanine carboxypeptidase [Ectothiorhodospira variabilis]MCG5504719.1 D-alanyl-D-alanine carboxypeptidase [Ectothiorhodospira variabilis]MCG5507876.1 D-alanyl-D-alanine carboxypeptidase [Ectothiorhodospira variabilis]
MIQRVSVFLLLFALLPGVALGSALRVSPPSDLNARNYVVMDAQSGAILAEREGDQRVEPASLTKIMTAYMVFRELQEGKLSLDEEVEVSERAWRTGMRGASRMFIEVGRKVTVEDLLRGMIIQSGNDACVALAERVAGTEGAFVDLMNAQARALGMHDTRFQNSHGLPSEADQYTSARDISRLMQALVNDFPEYYGYYAERSFTYNGISQSNRNLLLWRDDSVDGGKTGWTSSAGYNLVSSAKRDDMRLVVAVMGIEASSHEQGGRMRANESQALYNWAFRQFETHRVYEAGEPLTEARVWKGETKSVPLGLTEPFYVSIPRGSYEQLQAQTEMDRLLEAPIQQGASHGELMLVLGDEVVATRPLVALEAVEEGGLVRQLMDGAWLWIRY